MMDPERIKKIVKDAISKALLIDDEYGNPFEDTKKSLENSKLMYQSFKQLGKCLLDIYSYENYDEFESVKEQLFTDHELLILDWELNTDKQHPFLDTLKVISYAVQNTESRFIVIYTNSPELQGILYQIIGNFRDPKQSIEIDTIEKIIESAKEIIEDELLLDFNVEKFLTESDDVKGFVIEKDIRQEKEANFIESLQEALGIHYSEFCKAFNPQLRALGIDYKKNFSKIFETLDIRNHSVSKYDGLPYFQTKIIDTQTIQLNHTLITVIGKGKADSGVKPDDLYNHIVSLLANIPNHISLLFSLKLRTSLHRELGRIGRSIGMIDEGALLRQSQSYSDKNDLSSYLSTCVSCIVEDIIRRDAENQEYLELFEGLSTDCSDESLINLNRLLTFTPVVEMLNGQRRLTQGDVFKLDVPMVGNMNYLICISPVCDCAHTEDKPAFFHAFAMGRVVEKKDALEKTEKDMYIFVANEVPVYWTKYFLTINMTENVMYEISKPITVHFGKDETRTMSFVGNVKRLYAQRISNNVFTNASRIGVDLPHREI